MKKEAREFTNTVRERARNVWINLEINRMIRYQHSNLKSWVREDKNVMFYVDNSEHGGGPRWKDVRIRQTFDANTGYMIEYKVIHPWEDHHMRRLPVGVAHIKTIFRYEDTKDKRKGKHPNKISHNKKKKRNNKGRKKNVSKIVEGDYKDNDIPMMD